MVSNMNKWSISEIDELIHAKARLGIMVMLMTYEKCEFTFLKKELDLTDGNLSTHIKKLEDAKYLSVEKKFVKKKPMTNLKITKKGEEAFNNYVNTLESIVKRD